MNTYLHLITYLPLKLGETKCCELTLFPSSSKAFQQIRKKDCDSAPVRFQHGKGEEPDSCFILRKLIHYCSESVTTTLNIE